MMGNIAKALSIKGQMAKIYPPIYFTTSSYLLWSPQPRPFPEAQPFPSQVQLLGLLVPPAVLKPRALHGQIQEFLRHGLIGSLQITHQQRCKVSVLVGDESVRITPSTFKTLKITNHCTLYLDSNSNE